MKIKKLLFKNIYFILVFIVVVNISYISRPPIYGKLKFILLNTFYPSYDYARLFSEKSISINKNTFIKSDPITEYTLYSLYGNPTEYKDRIFETFSYLKLPISSINPLYYSANSACLINLKDFPNTWVPHLTGHWDPIIS
ncbi:MAG: hypothetical protein JJT78_16355, partial [Leptospira sp.]|nr:hypothetical protein [Leptospira sp.]